MSATPPEIQPRLRSGHEEEGKPAAFIAWALYILSIPSFNLLVIVGLIVAYAGRGSATGLARQHIDVQINLFWGTVWWTIGLWILIAISFVASFVLIGIPFLLVFAAALLILHIWFTIKSVLGLANLLGNRPA